jgi:hypothetical protein
MFMTLPNNTLVEVLLHAIALDGREFYMLTRPDENNLVNVYADSPAPVRIIQMNFDELKAVTLSAIDLGTIDDPLLCDTAPGFQCQWVDGDTMVNSGYLFNYATVFGEVKTALSLAKLGSADIAYFAHKDAFIRTMNEYFGEFDENDGDMMTFCTTSVWQAMAIRSYDKVNVDVIRSLVT